MPQPASSPALLIQRLNRALAPDYEVTRALGGGGMGFVYLARDRTLDRVVAIKAIRPELATESAVSRFLREARVLGRIRHPNIIPVHRAGTADGLPYYVMEYVEGETLAERLQRRRMPERESITTGRALLDALTAAHSAGVIHRDVKPANVFLTGSRVLLGDFGVARVDTTDPDATTTSGTIGTPAYMAPEQSTGGVVTEQSDIYAAGMVIYEMLTGRRWSPVADPRSADWSGVPRRYRHALRRALAWDPEQRWSRASAFRRVLAPRYRVMRRVTMSGWLFALLVVVAAVAYWWATRPAAAIEESDLAILPFRVRAGVDSVLGTGVASMIDVYIADIPQLSVLSEQYVRRLWQAAEQAGDPDETGWCRRLRATHCAYGDLYPGNGDTITMLLRVKDRSGRTLKDLEPGKGVGASAVIDLARHAAGELVDYLRPGFGNQIRTSSVLSDNPDAIRKYLQAEDWFYADEPKLATQSYSEALEFDSLFALARWHRIHAQRWTPGEKVDPRAELEVLQRDGPGRLDRIDLELVRALLLPSERARIEALREIADDSATARSREALPWMLWGEELFHRGPLAGYLFDSASVGLFQASALDPLWPQPLELLVWLHARQGRGPEAGAYLDSLSKVAGTPAAGKYAGWLRLAVNERFTPATTAGEPRQSLNASDAQNLDDFVLRMPFAFDMPDAEWIYAGFSIRRGVVASRITGYYGRFLADAARGRGISALAHLDSATALAGFDSARLHAAEWRVIPLALDIPLFDDSVRDNAREQLRTLARDPVSRGRALWALGIDAWGQQDTAAVRACVDSLNAVGQDGVAERLLPMLEGILADASGEPSRALALTSRSLDWDIQGRHRDPFARSVLHLLRSGWHLAVAGAAKDTSEANHNTTEVERDLRWAENLDIIGWPQGQPQAVEVDWVLGVEASRRRGNLAARLGDIGHACEHLERVRRFWSDATTPAIRSRMSEVERTLNASHCSQ